MSRIAVFAYGSLVSPSSAAETLEREVEQPIAARLEGWSRAWTLGRDNRSSEKTFARADGSMPRHCLGLNLEPQPGAAAPNGALIEVSESELDRLDLREMRYQRIEVTAAIATEQPMPFSGVFTYRARPAHHHPTPPDDAIVIANYLRTVEAAFAELGPGELDRFRATTAEVPVEITEASLVRDRIPKGNPRGW